jgi:hypothetical protein
VPSSSSESSSSSSKGFNGARCFWRLMMISPSFSFERTKARRVLSSLCFFVRVGKRTTEKKRASLFDLSFFSWAPFVLLCHFYVERERERDVKKRGEVKKPQKRPRHRDDNTPKRLGCSKTKKNKRKKKLSLSLSLSLSCELSPRDNEKTKTKTKLVFERRRQKWE